MKTAKSAPTSKRIISENGIPLRIGSIAVTERDTGIVTHLINGVVIFKSLYNDDGAAAGFSYSWEASDAVVIFDPVRGGIPYIPPATPERRR